MNNLNALLIFWSFLTILITIPFPKVGVYVMIVWTFILGYWMAEEKRKPTPSKK